MCYINPKQRIIAYTPICCGLWKWKRTKREMAKKKSDNPKSESLPSRHLVNEIILAHTVNSKMVVVSLPFA